jgi:hypothetical protein
VLSIISYFVVRSLQSNEALALQQAERLRNDVRHVQMLALTLGKSLQLTLVGAPPGPCPAGTTYWVIDCTVAAPDPCTGAPNTPIVDPATGQNFCVALEPGLALAGANFHFDPLGRPKTGAALTSTNVTFTVSGASTARTVVLTPLTGFVSAQ